MRYKYLLYALFFSVVNYSQESTIKVKLILTHQEDYAYTYEHARMLLTGDGYDKVLHPNRELEFELEGMKEGDYSFYVTPKNQLHSSMLTQYRFHYDPKTIIGHTMEIPFTPFCHYSKENKTCPVCCTEEHVIPISYGLIAVIEKKDKNGNVINDDKKKFKMGGCVVSDCDPQWYCEQDDVKF